MRMMMIEKSVTADDDVDDGLIKMMTDGDKTDDLTLVTP